MKIRHSDRKSAGFTIVELVIAATLFVLVLSAFAMSTRTATSYYEQGARQAQLDARAHRALGRILDVLPDAGAASLNPTPAAPLGATSLDFQCCYGLVGASVTWGPIIRIEYSIDAGEVNNGIDDDGDGLVDEAVVSWVENPGLANERRTVWCRNVRELLEGEQPNGIDDNGNGLVDEAGLSFELRGTVLIIRLSVDGLDSEGQIITKTVQSAVRLRN